MQSIKALILPSDTVRHTPACPVACTFPGSVRNRATCRQTNSQAHTLGNFSRLLLSSLRLLFSLSRLELVRNKARHFQTDLSYARADLSPTASCRCCCCHCRCCSWLDRKRGRKKIERSPGRVHDCEDKVHSNCYI